MTINRLFLVPAACALLIGAIGAPRTAAGIASASLSNAAPSSQLLAQNSAPNNSQPQQQRQGKPRHRIDFAAAAAKLGTTEAALKEALGVPAQPPERPRPNLQAAASQLGVSEEQLRQALGITLDPQTGQPTRPRTRPNLQAAAAQLNVTEAQLRTALGFPMDGSRPKRPQLNISGAAAKLGVTEAQLIEALGIPPRPPGEQPSN